jgi:hypothetical protein
MLNMAVQPRSCGALSKRAKMASSSTGVRKGSCVHCQSLNQCLNITNLCLHYSYVCSEQCGTAAAAAMAMLVCLLALPSFVAGQRTMDDTTQIGVSFL